MINGRIKRRREKWKDKKEWEELKAKYGENARLIRRTIKEANKGG